MARMAAVVYRLNLRQIIYHCAVAGMVAELECAGPYVKRGEFSKSRQLNVPLVYHPNSRQLICHAIAGKRLRLKAWCLSETGQFTKSCQINCAPVRLLGVLSSTRKAALDHQLPQQEKLLLLP